MNLWFSTTYLFQNWDEMLKNISYFVSRHASVRYFIMEQDILKINNKKWKNIKIFLKIFFMSYYLHYNKQEIMKNRFLDIQDKWINTSQVGI